MQIRTFEAELRKINVGLILTKLLKTNQLEVVPIGDVPVR